MYILNDPSILGLMTLDTEEIHLINTSSKYRFETSVMLQLLQERTARQHTMHRSIQAPSTSLGQDGCARDGTLTVHTATPFSLLMVSQRTRWRKPGTTVGTLENQMWVHGAIRWTQIRHGKAVKLFGVVSVLVCYITVSQNSQRQPQKYSD